MTDASLAFLFALKLCCSNARWAVSPYNTWPVGGVLIERAGYCAKADMVIPFIDNGLAGYGKFAAEVRSKKVNRCLFYLRRTANRLIEDCHDR